MLRRWPRRLGAWLRDLLPLGDINGRYRVRALGLRDPRLGRAQGLPLALKIRVHPGDRSFPAGIGGEVHARLFAELPGFDFKVVFACAAPDWRGQSAYADPRSPWFGLFFGYYEVSVSRREWSRPFGYRATSDGGWAPVVSELCRLGKADWNHFSAGLYGVPAAVGARYDGAEGEAPPVLHPRVPIGKRAYDRLELPRMRVVGPYGGHRGHAYRDRSAPIGWLWRQAFGRFSHDVPGVEPLAPLHVRAELYTACGEGHDLWTGEPVFRTWIAGGTQNLDHPAQDEAARLLELQLDEIRAVLRARPDLGFSQVLLPEVSSVCVAPSGTDASELRERHQPRPSP